VTRQKTAEQFRWQADAARALGSALYGVILDRCADDVDAGGPVADILVNHLDRHRGDAIALRMLAGVHALVLTGKAPDLAAYYPSAGGDRTPDAALWSTFADVLTSHVEAIRGWLDHAPQTNEVGRAAALAGGLRFISAEAALPVRLFEIGTSAGLNLRADQFRIAGRSASSGPESSPLVMTDAWLGNAPPEAAVEVVERVGVDLAPVDATTEDGRLRLMAFVWADQVARLERLRAAFEVAAEVPAELRSGDAVEAVRELSLREGGWTLLWHSVFRQYLDKGHYLDLVAAVDRLADSASPTARFGHLMLEPERDSAPDAFPVTLRTWPGGESRILGTAPAHGVPVTWSAAG
jgi:hypothetical protein